MALALSVPGSLLAQGFRVSGRVVRVVEGDSTPAAGVWAVFHQITTAGGAAVDSARSDAGGRYLVTAPARDSAAVYVVSVTYAGIAYFTSPLRPPAGTHLAAGALAVFDTSSTATIDLAQRHLIIRRAEEQGARRVLELLVLANTGARTRVAPDTSRPLWEGRLPRGAGAFEVGAGDLSAEAVYRRGDAIAVAAPIPPGEKQILVSYVLPATVRALEIDLEQPVGRLNVLVEDSAAGVMEGPLAPMGVEELEGVRFTRFEGQGIVPGTRIAVAFGRTPFSPTSLWWMVVALAAASLAAGLVPWWWRAGRGRAPPSDPKVLAAQLAAVEAALAQDGARLSDAERPAYQRRRDALKREIATLTGG